MNTSFKTLLVFLLGGVMTSCAMGPEPEGQSDAELGVAQSALEAQAAVEEAPSEPTAAQLEVAANADMCDTVCTVRRWVGQERYAEAREVLTEKLQAKPRDLKTVLMLTTVELMDEEYVNAYSRAQDYLNVAKEDVAVLERRARASLLGHDIATAVVDYRQLISSLQAKDDPQSQICNPMWASCTSVARHEAHAWAGLATAHYNQGRLDQAESIANDLLQNNELSKEIDPAHSHFVLALTAAKRDKDTEALAHYETILEQHPSNSSTLNNVGGIYYRAEDFRAARQYFEKAYENAGSWRRVAAIAWANIAELDMLDGNYEMAESKLFEALATSKNWAGGYFGLAVLYDVMGQKEKSARHMKKGLAIDEQGVTRWNTSFFHADWQTHFDALIAENSGDNAKAQRLWISLQKSQFGVLSQSAKSRAQHAAAATFNP